MATPTRTAPRGAQIASLALIVVTGFLLAGTLGSVVAQGLDSIQTAAVAFSALCGAIAMLAMFIALTDLWLRGRLTPASAKLLRALVIVAILAAMATAPLGRNSFIPIMLLPAAAIYYFAIRRSMSPRQPQGYARQPSGQPQPARTRQRRGGKKRR